MTKEQAWKLRENDTINRGGIVGKVTRGPTRTMEGVVIYILWGDQSQVSYHQLLNGATRIDGMIAEDGVADRFWEDVRIETVCEQLPNGKS